jgi:hypothetical protein
MNICPVWAELYDADGDKDGRTDRYDEVNSF